MYEPSTDQREWVSMQMSKTDYPQAVKTAVERLLAVWWTMNHSEQTRQMTLNLFVKLANNESLVVDQPDEVWAPLKPGNVVVRDRVRVKSANYPGDVGRLHNGRAGHVIAIRGGDVIVRYDDGIEPAFEGVHHSPFALEKRVR